MQFLIGAEGEHVPAKQLIDRLSFIAILQSLAQHRAVLQCCINALQTSVNWISWLAALSAKSDMYRMQGHILASSGRAQIA